MTLMKSLLCFFPIGTRIKVNLISFETLLYIDIKIAPFYSYKEAIYIELIEQSVYQINGIVLFLIDDFGVYLRHLHICMAEQF